MQDYKIVHQFEMLYLQNVNMNKEKSTQAIKILTVSIKTESQTHISM